MDGLLLCCFSLFHPAEKAMIPRQINQEKKRKKKRRKAIILTPLLTLPLSISERRVWGTPSSLFCDPYVTFFLKPLLLYYNIYIYIHTYTVGRIQKLFNIILIVDITVLTFRTYLGHWIIRLQYKAQLCRGESCVLRGQKFIII